MSYSRGKALDWLLTVLCDQSITYKAYSNNLMPASHKQPHLLLFYSDWCFSCSQVSTGTAGTVARAILPRVLVLAGYAAKTISGVSVKNTKFSYCTTAYRYFNYY